MFKPAQIDKLKHFLGHVKTAEKKVTQIRDLIREKETELREEKKQQALAAEQKTDLILGNPIGEPAKTSNNSFELHTLLCDLKKREQQACLDIERVKGHYRAGTVDVLKEIQAEQMQRYADLATQLAEAHDIVCAIATMPHQPDVEINFRNDLMLPGTVGKSPAWVHKHQMHFSRPMMVAGIKAGSLEKIADELEASLRSQLDDYAFTTPQHREFYR